MNNLIRWRWRCRNGCRLDAEALESLSLVLLTTSVSVHTKTQNNQHLNQQVRVYSCANCEIVEYSRTLMKARFRFRGCQITNPKAIKSNDVNFKKQKV